MTEWSQPDQAERFVREYADPILRVCAAGHLPGHFSHPAGGNTDL